MDSNRNTTIQCHPAIFIQMNVNDSSDYAKKKKIEVEMKVFILTLELTFEFIYSWT